MKVNFDLKDLEFPEKKTIMEYIRDINRHIPGVCKIKELDPYGSCRLCLVNVNNRILPACATYPKENDVIKTISSELISFRKTALELMLSDHYGDCIGPCNNGCPTKSEVQGYLALMANGHYKEAIALMKKDYILPATLGRICPAFCEKECRRNLVENPVAIRILKRFAADFDLNHNPWMPEIPPKTGKKIAVIGGGPGGLSCAFYSRIKGHDVTIFEAMPELGGMLRYGIPEYRLPKNILRKDIDTVIKTGITVKTNTRIGLDITIDELRKTYDALFLATGAWKSYQVKMEGCETTGVMDAIEFLRKISLGEKVDIGQTVMVVGGGNSAIDVARTARRLGANVILTYRRSRAEMPAEQNEIQEAEEEGVEFNLLSNPVKIIGEEKVKQVELIKMKLGEPDESGRCRPIECEGSNYCLDVDTIIFAIGQLADTELLDKNGIQHMKGWVVYDKTTYQTNIPGVFVGGDLAITPKTVIEAIATGKEAAIMIDLHLKGKLTSYKNAIEKPWEHLDEIEADPELKNLVLYYRPYNHWKKVTKEDYQDREHIDQVKARVLPAEKRITNFKEVESTITEEEAIKELTRCMSCGCLDSFECRLREFSKLYGAEQGHFAGELHKDPLDESHPFVTLDNNKCILCGRCVNLTHEITGEGLIDNLNRGFPTKNAPPVGMTLGDVKGDFIGNFVDECPTGAFTMKLPFKKNGPWNVKPKPTICNGCSLGCEMNIDMYMGIPINVSANEKSWNFGLICDKPRFERTWEKEIIKPLKKSGKEFIEITTKEATEIIAKHKKNLIIALSPNVTNEEALKIKEYGQKNKIKVQAIYDEGVSTANLTDILKSKQIKLEASLSNYPLLKPFIYLAKKQGAVLTKKNYDIAILEAPAEPENIPTVILHKGLNEVGLIKMGFKKVQESTTYLIIGDTETKLKGFTISMGYNKNADLILPLPAWIKREGKIINSEGRELKVNKVIKGQNILDIITSYL